jgi:hypothetical protein
LHINDLEDDVRTWLPSRDTTGNVVLSYRALPREINNSVVPGARVDLRTDQGGLIGSGIAFLPVPQHRDVTYSIHLAWNLDSAPVGISAVWTFGEGTSAHKIGPATDLETIFAVGPLKNYTSSVINPSGSRKEFGMYWFGQPPFNATEMAINTENLLLNMMEFFQDEDTSFRVFVRKSLRPSFGGTESHRSFMLEYDAEFNNFVKIDDQTILSLVAHETVHVYPAMESKKQISNDEYDAEAVWYSEGIATYYQGILPYRFGIFNQSQFIREMNKMASAYYTSPAVNISEDEAKDRSSHDTHAQRLPYFRGSMYLLKLDAALRAVSGGKRSLTEPMLALLKLKTERRPYTLAQWLPMIKAELGKSAIKDFENMFAGKLVVPPSDSMAYAGLKLVRADQERYELGFDVVSFAKHKIIGLVPGSRAAASGLREGDILEKSVFLWLTADNFNRNMELKIRRGDEILDISYWPRTWYKVESYQWVAIDEAISSVDRAPRLREQYL